MRVTEEAYEILLDILTHKSLNGRWKSQVYTLTDTQQTCIGMTYKGYKWFRGLG